MRRLSYIVLTLPLIAAPPTVAERDHDGDSGADASDSAPSFPPPPRQDDFSALMKNSPFSRVVKVEETYSLRGLARIDGRTFVTLQHRETKENIVVNDREENAHGMSLVEVDGTRPEEMDVRISFGGDEFEFSYEEAVLQPKAPPGTRDTVRRDKEGRAVTTDELMAKWRSLDKDKQKAYFRWKDAFLKARPELRFSEQRFPIAHRALDALREGKELPPVRR